MSQRRKPNKNNKKQTRKETKSVTDDMAKAEIIDYRSLEIIISRKRKQKHKRTRFSKDQTYNYYSLFNNKLKPKTIDAECLAAYVSIQDDQRFKVKGQFIDGYKSERQRMFKIKQNCSHNKYQSVSALMQKLKYSLNKFDDCTIGEAKEIKDKLIALFGEGNCNNCCIYIAANFFEITATKMFEKAGHYVLNTHPEISSWILVLTSSMMQYPQLFHFIWKLSSIRVILLNEFLQTLWNTNYKCKLEHQRINDAQLRNNPEASFWVGKIDFCGIALVQFQLLKNLKSISKNEWFSLICESIYFLEWMKFVLQQLKLQIFMRKDWQMYGHIVMMNFVWIIAYGFGLFIKYPKWKNRFVETYSRYKFSIIVWFDELEKLYSIGKMTKENPVYLCILSLLLCLKNSQFVEMKCKEINGLARDTLRCKWYEMECHNRLCINRRFMMNKFYKCKQCKVASYCSKKCQKTDWNKNNHKYVCNGLNALHQKCMKNEEKQRKMSEEERKNMIWNLKQQHRNMSILREVAMDKGIIQQRPSLKELVDNPNEYLYTWVDPSTQNLCKDDD